MAENKKSFVLYADTIETVEELTDLQAGKLFKHILKYVNDLNPESDDAIVKLAFIPIKQYLKRDLKKYESIVERNRNNGSKGGRPKKPKKPSGLIGNPKEPKKADSDNDSDTDINNSNLTVDWDGFREQFNSITGKRIRVIDEKSKKQIRARLKEGHDKDDLVTAIENCYNDSYHKETGYKYLTPEFISRPDKFQKYLNAPSSKKTGSISTQIGAL